MDRIKPQGEVIEKEIKRMRSSEGTMILGMSEIEIRVSETRTVDNPVLENKCTKVLSLDVPGQGGACHEYVIVNKENEEVYSRVSFQNGAIKEAVGVNGCHQEDLLAIVRDRLEHFQAGDYSCRENALALTKIEEAIHWLNHRTAARDKRGVEGTYEK